MMPLVKDGTIWWRLPTVIDSGAAENVMPASMLTNVPTVPSEGSRMGKYWLAANGNKIFIEGEKSN